MSDDGSKKEEGSEKVVPIGSKGRGKPKSKKTSKKKSNPEDKPKRGRPAYEVNDDDRRKVEVMASLGISHADAAKVMGIAKNTLAKHYANELKHGSMIADVKVVAALFKNATVNENVAAQIFWCKTRLGWKENPEPPPEPPEDRKIIIGEYGDDGFTEIMELGSLLPSKE